MTESLPRVRSRVALAFLVKDLLETRRHYRGESLSVLNIPGLNSKSLGSAYDVKAYSHVLLIKIIKKSNKYTCN